MRKAAVVDDGEEAIFTGERIDSGCMLSHHAGVSGGGEVCVEGEGPIVEERMDRRLRT